MIQGGYARESGSGRTGGMPIARSPSGVRSENTPQVRFSATVGEEPEIEVEVV
jgi:hypothetical protein